MNDLKLDTTTHDLVINSRGDLELLNSEESVARQTLVINLLTYKGEWFLDLEYGVPYLQTILKKGTSKKLVDNIIKETIRNSYNIRSISKFESSVDNQTYKVNIFEGLTNSGEIVSITNQILFEDL